MIAERSTYLLDLLKIEKLDAILFFGLPNMRYLSGFTGTDGVLLIGAVETQFFTDSRYQEQAQNQVSTDRITCYKNKFKTIVEELQACGYRRVGFEAAAINVAQYEELTNISRDSFEWVSLTAQLQLLRAVKSADELSALKQAASLNQQAFDIVMPLIKPGVTELKIALELEYVLKQLGGEINAFDFIVASGSRGALPHGIASDKRIQEGELVTIDFGTRIDGYYSDETVTLAVGEVDRNLRQIFDIVLEAHDSALAAVCSGKSICGLDAVARDFITANGYGQYFGHGLGHGVGLEVHEFPSVSAYSDKDLMTGMVITIEPGIYIPELGGVRIEDTVVVTGDGYQSITTIPKQFKQLST